MSAWTDAVAVHTANILGWWRQGEASGTTMVNSGPAGAARNGTYFDSPTLGQPGLIAGDSTTSASYSGSSDISLVFYGSWMNTTTMTAVTWVKSVNGAGTNLVMTRDDNVSNRVFGIFIQGGFLRFDRHGPTVSLTDVTTPLSGTDPWMLAAVHDGTQIRLNINGVDVAQVADPNPLTTPAGAAIAIGGNNVSSNIGGPMQEVLFLDAALTETQLADLYAAGLGIAPPGDPTGLTADPTGTTIDFGWDASTGSPTGYEVRIDGGAEIDVGLVLTHEFTGLTEDTVYELEVRAYNGSGFSAWASLLASTDVGPPDVPEDLITTPNSTTILLQWSPPDGC